MRTKSLSPNHTRAILFRIGLILSGLIIAALGLFSILSLALCGLDNPYAYGSCITQYLAISGSLAIVLIAACLAARKYPFVSGAVLIVIGTIPFVILLLTPSDPYLLIFSVPFYIVGLLYLSMGCFDQAATRNHPVSPE